MADSPSRSSSVIKVNQPGPTQYSQAALKQGLKLKPQSDGNPNRETVNMDKMTSHLDREGFLYVKPPKDYWLGYHQKVQEGRSLSTLKEHPGVKLAKADRAAQCEFQEQYKILDARAQKVQRERSERYIRTFDEHYDNRQILSWFAVEHMLERVTSKQKEGLAPLKLYNRRSQHHQVDTTVAAKQLKNFEQGQNFRTDLKKYVYN